jgi:hypothetical protein
MEEPLEFAAIQLGLNKCMDLVEGPESQWGRLAREFSNYT